MAERNDDYEIRRASKDDIPMIMEYIGEDWKEGHILATNRTLFEYEFLEPDGNVNMVIAVNLSKNRIDGCLGFLKTSRNTEIFDMWGSVWKVRKDSHNMLGLEILEYVRNIPGSRYYLGIGMNPNTSVKIHDKLLKESVGKMKHWYYLADRGEYKLAIVRHKDKKAICQDKETIVKCMTAETFAAEFDQMQQDDASVPRKNKEYYLHRYFGHPIYAYQTWGIYYGSSLKAIFVMRKDCHEGRRAVRIVDYYGDERYMYGMEKIVPDLFEDESVEYVDFYESGFSDANVRSAGFCLLEEDDANVIPNYFGPFVQENIDIWITSPVEKAKFVKGDGDQDRPSNSNP